MECRIGPDADSIRLIDELLNYSMVKFVCHQLIAFVAGLEVLDMIASTLVPCKELPADSAGIIVESGSMPVFWQALPCQGHCLSYGKYCHTFAAACSS